ncbi:hypothetical protein [Bacillus cereus group sp. BfR-BA-01331]|uniref:hypothetical protein n=1 Tax=Bacillus cereus group sp. BfR-BA-01331 TaxID=2920307 RepID=UPI001F59F879|nr:hypothetical protein [Bacillus cereus group sp. BfR-BA-01331]
MNIIVLRRILIFLVLILLGSRIFDFDLFIGITPKVNVFITIVLFILILLLHSKSRKNDT